MASNSEVLREKIKEVSQSMGAYVFTIGDHFIQIASMNKGEIYCEAVSHHLIDLLSPALEPAFRSLGYTIDEGSNYSKTYSATDDGIEHLIRDAEIIFRDYYLANHNLPFEVMDAE